MKQLVDAGDLSISEIASMFGINRTTLRRTLNRQYEAE
ncbi:helix-turn-helix domain-containing protein [Corynebacterium heidelbergense]